jgi:hypothetical protein
MQGEQLTILFKRKPCLNRKFYYQHIDIPTPTLCHSTTLLDRKTTL